jgi:drug/metabolite transporter (DMT)-like permease
MVPLYQAVVLLYLYPSHSVVLSAIINREGVAAKDLAGVLVALAGCVVLVWPTDAAAMGLRLGHLMALAGGALYALSIVLARRLGQGNGGLEPIFFYSLFAGLAALPLALLSGQGLGLDSLAEARRGALLGLLGSSAQLLAYLAIRYLPPFKVGVIGTLEILGSALFSLLFFNDRLGLQSLAGGILILYAAFGFHHQPKVHPIAPSGPKDRKAGKRTRRDTARPSGKHFLE